VKFQYDIPQEYELTLTQNGNTALNYLGYSFRKHHTLRGNIIHWVCRTAGYKAQLSCTVEETIGDDGKVEIIYTNIVLGGDFHTDLPNM
jgi:hypothetical protein